MSEAPLASGRAKREHKQIESFVPDSPRKETAEFTVPTGAGTKFGEIENIKLKIDKLNAMSDELKTLHRVCFGRPGQKTTLKRTLREFSGFAATEDLSKKEATISKLDGKMIKALLTTCDQSTSGTKAQNVESLLAFLKEPAASGKRSIAEIASEKRAKNARKRERVEKKKAKAAKAAAKAKGKAAKGKAKAVPELKRPPNAFMLYCEAKRDKVKAENPDAKITEISKILGEKWKGISEERRANYEARAKEAKDEYEKKKAALEAKKGASSKPPPAKKQKVEKEEEEEEEEDDDDDDDDDDDEEGDDEEEGDDDEEAAEEEPAEEGDAPEKDDAADDGDDE